jgi:RNA polymerase sigma factor (sigma-70 family)
MNQNMQSLEQIVRGCKRQDAWSQKVLYQQYFSLMLTICMRYGRSREDAEEMLNNGFLKIFTNIGQFEGKGSFEGWMKRIMANSCLDYLKSRLHRNSTKMVALTDENGDIDEHFDNILFSQGYFAENGNEEKFSKMELISLLQQLPELTRTVFNMYVFEEYSHREIAAELNMAERTSQWHISNARKTLADALQTKKNPKKKIAGI